MSVLEASFTVVACQDCTPPTLLQATGWNDNKNTRKIPGWVTVFGGHTISVCYQTSMANSSLLPSVGWIMSTGTGQSVVMLWGRGVKAGMVHSTCG